MPKLVSLNEIICDLQENFLDETNVSQLANSSREEERIVAILIKAALAAKKNDNELALDILSSAYSCLGYIPLVIIGNIIELALKTKNYSLAAKQCFNFALCASKEKADELALEAASAAIIFDSQSDFSIIRNPEKSSAIAKIYETAAIRNQSFTNVVNIGKNNNTKIKIALIIPNLVDHIIGYVKTAVHIAKYIDKNKFELSVFVSENLSKREKLFFPFGCIQRKSEKDGKETIQLLKQYGAEVLIMPRNKSFIDTAKYMVELISQRNFDALILQTGLACPIDWLCGYWLNIPVKIALHNGSSLFLPRLSASFYDNPINLERENCVWKPEFGERIVARQGTDIEEMSLTPALKRNIFSIPADAIIVGTMSNHLQHRLSKDFLEVISDILHTYKNVFFIAFGGEKPDHALRFFKELGLQDRFIYAGKQKDSAAALKMLDIYACEFPVGGSQSVVEAISCGIPVVAMRWSDAHAESAAAEIIGNDFAINERNIHLYKNRLEELILNKDKREEIGRLLRKRAEELYSVKNYTKILSDYIAQKIGASNK